MKQKAIQTINWCNTAGRPAVYGGIKMSQPGLLLRKAIYSIYGIMLLTIFIICLFLNHINYYTAKKFALPNLVLLFVGAAALGALFLLIKFIMDRFPSTIFWDVLILLLSVVLGIVLSIMAYHYYFRTGWDAGVVIEEAYKLSCGEPASSWYFSRYPNNILLTVLYSVIIRFVRFIGVESYYFALVIFQCFVIPVTGFIVYQIVCTLKEERRYGVFAWLLYVLLVGISPWVVVPYSDTMGLLFTSLAAFFYLKIGKRKRIPIFLFLFSFISFLGYHIKPQLAIIGIAAVVLYIIRLLENFQKEKKLLLIKIIWSLAGITAGFLIVQLSNYSLGIELEQGQRMGMAHFLMMGFNEQTNGVYSESDVEFSLSFASQQDRTKANLVEWKRRVKEYGIVRTGKLLSRKLLTNFNDGTFAWGVEGGFFQETYELGNPKLADSLKSFYYPDGSHYSIFSTSVQAVWLTVLFFCLFAVMAMKKSDFSLLLGLSVIGLALFELLFEARARYLFAYTPIFICLASLGMEQMYNSWKFLSEKYQVSFFTKRN